MKPIPRSALWLTLTVVTCAAKASVLTLIWDGAFPASSHAPTVLAEARGWSAVTLVLVVPLCLVSLWAARRGSTRGRLAWLGTLAYLVYTYLELAVSPPFSALYLLYVAAFACAIPALVIGATSIQLERLEAPFRRVTAVFAGLVAVFLSLAWLRGIVTQTLAGDFGWPDGTAAVGHVVHALDLGLQVPLAIATAVMLLRRRPGAVLLGAVMLINSACMGAALTAMVFSSATQLGSSRWQAAPFALLCLVASALAAAFFGRGFAAPKRQ